MKNKYLIAITLFCFALALPGRAADNLLKNSSFEDEDSGKPGQAVEWAVFTQTGQPGLSALSRDAAKDGKNSFKLAFEGKTEQFVGLSQNVPVNAGQKLKFSIYVRNVSLQGDSYAQLGLEWKDASGKEVSRDLGEGMNPKNTRIDDWTRFEVTAAAPAGTSSVTCTVTIHTGKATDGAVLLDNVGAEIVQ